MSKLKMKSILIVFLAVVAASALVPAAHAQGNVTGIYTAKCAACHGPDGSAATPAGKAVQARDFHTAVVQNQSDADLAVIVTKGKNKMPAYEKILTADQIKGLVAYCRNLGKK